MSRYYPLWLDIEGRKCLVVGGGAVAARKVRSLLECGARIVLISPVICEELQGLARDGRIAIQSRSFCVDDVDGASLVFAATSDASVNMEIAGLCRERDIPANIADNPEIGTFMVPAVLRRGPLSIGVSTEGGSPIMAQRLRNALGEVLGEEYGDLAEWLAMRRSQIQEEMEEIAERKKAYEEALQCLEFDFEGPRMKEYKERIKACISFYRE